MVLRAGDGLALWLLPAVALADAPAGAEVDVVERLGERVPLELEFADSTGRPVRLSEAFAEGRPVALLFVYYRCPTLCGLLLDGAAGALKQTGYRLGQDYAVVTVSVDPSEGPEVAAEKKAAQMKVLGSGDANAWYALTGDEAAVRQLAEAVGFRYAYDADVRQFAHAAAMVLLTPDGKVSRYLYGVRFGPRDVRLALLEAAGGKVGSALERFILTCYRYDSQTRRYQLYVKGILQGGGLLVFFALAGMLAVFWRREIRHGHGRRPR